MENYVNNLAVHYLLSRGIKEINVEDPLSIIHLPQIMISLKPQFCELIASGKKTVELRKNTPKISVPFKCYIYCTKDKNKHFWTGKRYSYIDERSHNAFDKEGNGKIIGEFVCDYITEYEAEFHKEEDSYQDIQKVWIDEDYPEDGEQYLKITANDEDDPNDCELCIKSCLSFMDIKNYIGGESAFKRFFGWHISFLKIYEEPKELNEFVCNGKTINRPPQSWCYIEKTTC